jgi:transmembrane sensor
MAAMVAGLALIGLLTLQAPGLVWQVLADHHTGAQDRRDVALPDGSTVSLGASSALSVAFDGPQRRVVLHRGEAYFAVASDPNHPFIVEAGSGTVTVLGTKFGVKIADARVTVGVAEGVVSVAAGPGAPIRLQRGETARYGAGGLARGEGVDVADVGSWRDGRLIFQGLPLGEVLEDLERYRGGRIFVTDGRLAALPVTGVFDITRADGALDTIARALPIRVTRIGDLVVLVQPAE